MAGAMAGADAVRERIEAHSWPRGGVEVVRANRGYTLYSRRTGGQVARLRPTGEGDDVQVLCWRRDAWAAPGDFGPVIMCKSRHSICRTVSDQCAIDGPHQSASAGRAALKPGACGAPLRGSGA